MSLLSTNATGIVDVAAFAFASATILALSFLAFALLAFAFGVLATILVAVVAKRETSTFLAFAAFLAAFALACLWRLGQLDQLP